MPFFKPYTTHDDFQDIRDIREPNRSILLSRHKIVSKKQLNMQEIQRTKAKFYSNTNNRIPTSNFNFALE